MASLKAIQQLCLSRSIKLKEHILSHGGIQILFSIPASEEPEEVALLSLISLLVECSIDAAELLVSACGLTTLAWWLHSARNAVSSLACNILKHMASHKQARLCKECLRHGIPRRLNDMLQSKMPQLQLSAAQCIFQLAKSWRDSHGELHKSTGQAVEALARNGNADPAVRSAAANAADAIKPSGSFKLKMPSFMSRSRSNSLSPPIQQAAMQKPASAAVHSLPASEGSFRDLGTTAACKTGLHGLASPEPGPSTPPQDVAHPAGALSFQHSLAGSSPVPSSLSSPAVLSALHHELSSNVQHRSQRTLQFKHATFPQHSVPSTRPALVYPIDRTQRSSHISPEPTQMTCAAPPRGDQVPHAVGASHHTLATWSPSHGNATSFQRAAAYHAAGAARSQQQYQAGNASHEKPPGMPSARLKPRGGA